jgi:hypothetical protein
VSVKFREFRNEMCKQQRGRKRREQSDDDDDDDDARG